MRIAIPTFFWMTILGSLSALILSIWPGYLNDLDILVILIGFCLSPILLAVLLTFVVQLFRRPNDLLVKQRRQLILLPLVLFLSLGLLVFYIPRRIAFRFHQRAFEAIVVNVPVSERGVAADRRVGMYRVDEFAADPRGGVYFRVYAGMDGIGPDTMSYGFVKSPNSMGSPFGASKYRAFPLIGDWHWFRASNDW